MSPRQQTGLTLRLLGPVVEIIGLIVFLNDPGDRTRLLGVSGRTVGLVLLATGLVLVIAGLLMSRRVRRPARLELDLDTKSEGDSTL